MRKKLGPITALLTAFVMLLAVGAARTSADNPRDAAKKAADKAKSAVEAAKQAHAAAEKARNDKAPDLDKKEKAEDTKFEQAQAALKAAQQALAAIPEGHDLTTQKQVGDELDELDAVLKVLGFIEPNALQRRLSAFPPDDAKGKKEAQEEVNNAADEIEKAIKKLPPEKRKDLQKQLEDRRKELIGYLALGAVHRVQRIEDEIDIHVPVTPSSTTRDGLRIVTFDTLQGRVIVNLPDDMMAGDTISGTVSAEPKGNTPDERKVSAAKVSEVNLIFGSKFPKDKKELMVLITPRVNVLDESAPGASDSNQANFTIKLPETFDYTIGVNAPRADTGTVTIKINSPVWFINNPPTTPSTQPPGSGNDVILPPTGQQGRPIEILSPPRLLGGNAEKMICQIGGQDAKMLAASPGKVVLESPTNITGPTEITLKDGNVEAKGTFRNVGVHLSAPKTNLLKGEHTTVTFEVKLGTPKPTEPVPATITSEGVITMEGGNYQQLLIQPSQVDEKGNYITTREVTGVQTGVWGATLTVVTKPFNVCLQDDNNAQTVLLINSFTGDYKFTCPGCPQTGGTSTQTGGTQTGGTQTGTGATVVPATGPTGPIVTGTGTIMIKGCTITLEDNAPDRKVSAKIDNCTKTGSATIVSPPKIKFTIIDRNTTDNTCTCGPGCK